MVKGKRQIKAREVDPIKAFFNLPLGKDASSAKLDMREADPGFTMAEVNSWPNDVVVYGTALGGSSGGDFTMNGDSGIRVRRPPRLAGRVDILALFVRGDSMEPRYRQGDLIYLEKARPPQINDYVVIEMRPGPDGEQPAFLKQLAGRSGTKIRLRQHNPDKIIEIEQASILQVIRVMNLQDILG
jgi:phage repressor protein C with HTH and peptisase S24 domain